MISAQLLAPLTCPHFYPIFTLGALLFPQELSTSHALSCTSMYLPAFFFPWPSPTLDSTASPPPTKHCPCLPLGSQPGHAEKGRWACLKSEILGE